MQRTNDPSRDLLRGLLALQVGLVDQERLVAAFRAWTRDKSRPIVDHLIAHGGLQLIGGTFTASLATGAAISIDSGNTFQLAGGTLLVTARAGRGSMYERCGACHACAARYVRK